MRRVMLWIFFLLASHCQYGSAQSVVIPVSYTTAGSVYFQNFDGLPNSGSYALNGKGPVNLSGLPVNGNNLAGWQLLMTGGSNTNAAFAVSTGSSTGNGVYSLGSSGATERALGSLSSGTGMYAIGLVLTNTTGSTLNTFTLSFTAEQWRKGGSTNKNTWAFRYKTGVFNHIDQPGLINEDRLDLYSLITTSSGSSLDGNQPLNQQAINFTVTAINWKNGEQLLLRWDDADEPGNDDVCGIDNLNFSARQVSSAPSVTSKAATGVTAGSASLNGTANDNFSNTTVVFELDTLSTFLNAATVAAVPASIPSGVGNTAVSATLSGLNTGSTYYFRTKAINTAGTATALALSFTTAFSVPVVTTSVASGIFTSMATLGGAISSTGGAAIIDKGIVWSLNNNPTILNNRVSMGNGTAGFMQAVTGLPQGTMIYARAYASNQAGTAYGNNEAFTTQTSIVSLVTTSPTLTNAATVHFTFQTAQPITGLLSSHFVLSSNGITGASITGITGSGTSFSITVQTGTGDGSVQLKLEDDSGISPSIHNKPFTATSMYTIDKNPPLIRSVSIPDRSMKIGDTVPVTVSVKPDPDNYKIATGTINGFVLSAPVKKNDSIYTSSWIVASGTNDIAATAHIPVTLALIDSVGNISTSFQTPIVQTSDPLDANKPFITHSVIPLAAVYKMGDTLKFIFRFNEKIAVASTTIASTLSITIGTKTKSAVYAGSSMSDSLVFRYIIQPADSDKDGIRIGSSITLNGAVITDVAGNPASLLFNLPSAKNIFIDGIAPMVSSVTVPPAAVYKTGNILDFLINYTEKVVVTAIDSAPFLAVSIGSAIKNAMYIGGTGSNAILFRYSIQADDMDKDGIKLVSPINLNNATIQDEAGNPASLILSNIGALSNISINPVTAAVSYVTVPSPGLYKAGDTLAFTAGFTEKINVITTAGTPSLKFTMGGSSKHAFYHQGFGSNNLLFLYTIQPGDEDSAGLKMNTTISLNNGLIQDTRGNNIPLSLHNTGTTIGIMIDAVSPFIQKVTIPVKNLYKDGDTLDFIVRFNEKIKLTAATQSTTLSLTIGTKSTAAWYVRGSSSDSLLFRYIIQPGDLDTDGITIGHSITLNGASLTDGAGNTASLLLIPPSAKKIIIDAVAPTVLHVITPPAGIYRIGKNLDFFVTFSEKVWVHVTDRVPFLSLDIGGSLQKVLYISGTGSNSLLFSYSIQAGDMDTDGPHLVLSINQNNGVIQDDAGNSAASILNNISGLDKIIINTITVEVDSVIVPAPGIYKTGDTLAFLTRFTGKTMVTTTAGIPSLNLTVGNKFKQAFYRNGSGSTALTFIYVIQPGDEDSNGIKLNSTLSLNNGLLKDVYGNDVSPPLTHTGLISGVLVDAVPPMVKNVLTPPKNIYKEGDTLNFLINFTEKVILKNSIDMPFLKLIIGNALKNSIYTSGSGTPAFLFRYIVQKGDLDKNGIKLDSVLTTGNGALIDAAGNEAQLNLKNTGTLSTVKIDAVPPVFLTANPTIFLCENASAASIAEPLTVNDEELGELLSWLVISGGDHGTITKRVYSSASNGNSITPNGMLYKPLPGYTGHDTITVQVSDGVNHSQKTIFLTIQPIVKNNLIGPSQVVCPDKTPAPITGSTPAGGDGIYRLTWELSADSTGFSKAGGTNNLQHYNPAKLAATTWFRRKVESGACMDVSGTSQITVVINGLWTGSMNTDWGNPGNWCNGIVPDHTTDVFIYGNTLHGPVIKDTARCNHLTLFNNARVTVTGVLQVTGNFINASGSIDARKATLMLAGNTPQNIPAGLLVDGVLENLVINNPTGISLSGPLSVSDNVLLNSGYIITNDHLALQHTAKIGPSATGTFITGNTTIAHSIKAGKKAFRLLGHPFSNSLALDMIKDSIDITGMGGSINGFTNTANHEPSAFWHDPLKANDSIGIDAGWTGFTHTNGLLENAWKEFSGIRLLINSKHPQMLNLSGQVHTGDKELVLPKGNNPTYHVIANPYPSPIDLSLVSTGSNLGIHYWIWNPRQAAMGGYSSVPFKIKNSIPSFGVFIVKANVGSDNTLLFTENCKVNNPPSDNVALIHADDTYYVELRLETDSVFWDRIVLFQVDSARSGFDKNDAEKFRNDDVNFYSLSREKKMLSIDARPVTNESTIGLGVQTNAPGQYTIRVAALSLPASNKLMLHDKHLNQWMKLDKDSSYHFLITADTATMGNNRFEITAPKKIPVPANVARKIIVRAGPVPARDRIIVSYNAPEKANTTIRVLGLNGMPVKILALGLQKEGQVTIPIADIVNGIYILEVRSGDKITTQKIIKE